MSDVDFRRLARDMAGRDGIAGSMIIVAIGGLVGLLLV